MMEEPATAGDTVTALPRKRSTALYAIVGLLLAAVLIGGALYWHKHSVGHEVQGALEGETGARIAVYRRELVGGNDIVFDLETVDGATSMVDITRKLLKSAEALAEEDFGRVYLAFSGEEKFYLEGAYFKRLGAERDWQNPIYTIRTMPENVRKLDGSSAFETWTGGWLGVMGQQMNDNNEFHRQWWVNDAITDLGT